MYVRQRIFWLGQTAIIRKEEENRFLRHTMVGCEGMKGVRDLVATIPDFYLAHTHTEETEKGII